MRNCLAFVLVTTLSGCGGSDEIVGMQPDAREPSDDAALVPPPRGFQIVTSAVDINPGVEATYCYYFRTPNTTELAIQKWASHMTAGSHHMILYFTSSEYGKPGTLDDRCGFATGGVGPVWTYSAQTADAEAALPRDDGNGVPVGQPVKAGQLGFIQLHYLNATDDVIHAQVTLNAIAYDEGVKVTPAAPFVTYHTGIKLEPGNPVNPTPGTVSGSCDIGADAKFYTMSTHTHKQGVHTFVKDGADMVFESRSWEHPGAMTRERPPFFSFTSGKLTYQCEYLNPNNYMIEDGDSAATAEMCMAVGYYFPAVGGTGHLCLNSLTVY
jgi:hypothetical protein